MKCLRCNSNEFEAKIVPFTVALPSTDNVSLWSEAMVCTKCSKAIMDTQQMDNFLKAIKECRAHAEKE